MKPQRYKTLQTYPTPHILLANCPPDSAYIYILLLEKLDKPHFFATMDPVMAEAKSLDWLSIGEAAKFLGVSRDTLRRWEKRGKIKSYRTPGGRRRYTMYDLELAMKSPKPVPPIISKPKPPEQPKQEITLEEPKVKSEPEKQARTVQLTPPSWFNLRTLVLGLALIIPLLILFPAAINVLLSFLKGPSEPLNPIPGA